MTTQHPYADLLIAIANGEQMQILKRDDTWVDVDSRDALFVVGNSGYCRVKPKTITVNGVECRAEASKEDAMYSVVVSIAATGDECFLQFETVEDAVIVYEALIKPFNEAGK